MANIHFIGGEKGGIGKSLVARVVAQYLIDHQQPFLGFDTDRSHGSLLRFYAGYASPVLVDSYASMDAIIEAAVEQPERRILVDLAAQTSEPLTSWMDESGVLELGTEAGYTIRYWHVMDNGKDAVDMLKKLLDRFDNRVQYVLVRNHLRGDDFSALEASGEQARAIALGAHIIELKHLNDAVIQKIDAGSLSFWSAQNTTDKTVSSLGLLDRQRVKMWWRDVSRQLDQLAL